MICDEYLIGQVCLHQWLKPHIYSEETHLGQLMVLSRQLEFGTAKIKCFFLFIPNSSFILNLTHLNSVVDILPPSSLSPWLAPSIPPLLLLPNR